MMLKLRRCTYPLQQVLLREVCDRAPERQLSSKPYAPRGGKKSASNPGVNAEQFRDLFRAPQGKMRQPRYKLRWDWHLRNFLTALIPPAAMLVFFRVLAMLDSPEIQLYEARFEGKDPITGKISTLKSPDEDPTSDPHVKQAPEEELHIFLRNLLKDRLKPIEEELERLRSVTSELLRDALESEEAIKRIEDARRHSKRMVRPAVEKETD